ncbi:MAG: ParB/RepB/Spo0J family partition protein [Bacilli bacterium]|nr:ParB/RepB/Spo0J family partition protein [Bacilli bacterium]MDY5058852.1 ParB/RepB/Spo0J family partition protein [Bacilli bacterium]
MDSIVNIKISLIDDFKNHPFLVNDDDTLKELAKSIKENGLLNPIIVRPKNNNRYELISGHRRKLAMQLNGIDEIDAVIKELDDDEATIYMVDSNIYRERILPSEKAFAYKMKIDALKHQGKTLSPKGTKQHSVDQIDDTKTQIYRYIRLTYLIPDLLKLVDNSVLHDKRTYLTIGIKPAVELSYLTKDEQNLLYSTFIYDDLTPSHGQAIKIRELSKNKKLNYDSLVDVLSQIKGNQKEQISFNKEKIESVLPMDLLKRDKRYIEQFIIEAILKYKEIKKEELEKIDINNLKI